MKEHGLLHLLERAAELLERNARELFAQHRRACPQPDTFGARFGSRKDYDELMSVAKGLRRAHAYHKPNPLGGPAKMFDAIADRIRAGEPLAEFMADYGIAFTDQPAGSTALDNAAEDR